VKAYLETNPELKAKIDEINANKKKKKPTPKPSVVEQKKPVV